MPLTAIQSLTDPSVILQTASAANPLTPISTTQGKTDPLSYSLQWNLGVQQDLGKGIIVEAAYVASRGVHLPLILPYNDIPLERALDAARTTPSARTCARIRSSCALMLTSTKDHPSTTRYN